MVATTTVVLETLVSVTFIVAVWPMTTLPKASGEGVIVSAVVGATPVPVRLEVWVPTLS
jgi:hypothetical protein